MPTYTRGRKPPPNLQHLKDLSHKRYAHALSQLPKATEPTWDSRTQGWVGKVKDQSQCGSCWDFSGTGTIEIAAVKAGVGTADAFILSEQYTLDCGNNGGCNGDDNTNVLDWAVKYGLPFTADYGNYQGGAGRCKFSAGMKMFKVDHWLFVDGAQGNGITDTQKIKDAIKAFGAVGCAVAAGSSWDGYSGGVHTGNSTSIDHDVILVGWNDDASVHGGGSWIMRNSWTAQWGDQGYMHIAYGADSIGTEAVAAVVIGPTPPPGPVDWSKV